VTAEDCFLAVSILVCDSLALVPPKCIGIEQNTPACLDRKASVPRVIMSMLVDIAKE
jgi:hypothetical protein